MSTNTVSKQIKKQMEKVMKNYGEEVVRKLSTKYKFDYEEGMKAIEEEDEEMNRGRPTKTVKKVVNKVEMVEDVISTLLKDVTQTPEPGPTKKRAPAKKKTPEATSVETATGEVAAPGTAVAPEKKKRAPAKKKTPEPTTVVATAEAGVLPVVATATATEVVAPVTEVAPEKKKRAPAKKKTPEPTAVTAEAAVLPVVATATVEVAAPAVVAPVTEVKEKKKKSEKKKEKTPEPVVVATPVVEEKELVAETIDTEDEGEEEGFEVEPFNYKGIDYLLGDDKLVYSVETNEHVGSWDGEKVILLEESETL